ncbi:Arc family DNA-binding protein [Frankia sp. Cppng1_Ct_nod]|nr:Arc family DNA-binding protein [Frankia sp. Cppng1_Ct_nod]
MKNLNVRLPDDLHARLVEAAKEDTRSLNSEIIHLLREALERRS